MEAIAQRLVGRRALVTGAGSGIGRATAQRLAAEGAAVFCVDLNQEGAEETRGQIEAAGGQAGAVGCDVRQPSDCEASVAAAIAAFGGIDLLCNIAGVLHFDHTEELSDEVWDRVLGVNLTGMFYMSRAALPHLRDRGAAIVNLASLAGIQAVPFAAAYCASKGGAVMLTKSLAVEYAKTGPRVNCICPGGIATPMVAAVTFPEGADPAVSAHVSPRMDTVGKPEEVAALVAYLGSDEARYVTGSAFTIDGGQGA
jgi:meso-butanediol dehydrogenase/(S,S)-butanediol dehydrogenase/diacetyl reductase